MKPIIDLLRKKNHYLVQFEKISAQECQRLQSNDFSHIERFYHRRQTILDAIETIDKHLQSCKPQKISLEDNKTAQKLLRKKREIAHSIMQKEMLIHSCLSSAQYDMVEDQIA